MIKAQFSDIVKAYEMIVTAKTAGLDFWEGFILILFIILFLLLPIRMCKITCNPNRKLML